MSFHNFLHHVQEHPHFKGVETFCFSWKPTTGQGRKPRPHKTLNEVSGGAGRDRTDDILLAKQALSQLSYSPDHTLKKMVGLVRFELTTSRLSSARSNQLSYKPVLSSLLRINAHLQLFGFPEKGYDDGEPVELAR